MIELFQEDLLGNVGRTAIAGSLTNGLINAATQQQSNLDAFVNGGVFGALTGLTISAAEAILKRFFTTRRKYHTDNESIEIEESYLEQTDLPTEIIDQLTALNLNEEYFKSQLWQEVEKYIREVINNPEIANESGATPDVIIAALVKVSYTKWKQENNIIDECFTKINEAISKTAKEGYGFFAADSAIDGGLIGGALGIIGGPIGMGIGALAGATIGALVGLYKALGIAAAAKISGDYIGKNSETIKPTNDFEQLPQELVIEINKLNLEEDFYKSDIWKETELYIKNILKNPESTKEIKPLVVITSLIKTSYNLWKKQVHSNDGELSESATIFNMNYDNMVKLIENTFIDNSELADIMINTLSNYIFKNINENFDSKGENVLEECNNVLVNIYNELINENENKVNNIINILTEATPPTPTSTDTIVQSSNKPSTPQSENKPEPQTSTQTSTTNTPDKIQVSSAQPSTPSATGTTISTTPQQPQPQQTNPIQTKDPIASASSSTTTPSSTSSNGSSFNADNTVSSWYNKNQDSEVNNFKGIPKITTYPSNNDNFNNADNKVTQPAIQAGNAVPSTNANDTIGGSDGMSITSQAGIKASGGYDNTNTSSQHITSSGTNDPNKNPTTTQTTPQTQTPTQQQTNTTKNNNAGSVNPTTKELGAKLGDDKARAQVMKDFYAGKELTDEQKAYAQAKDKDWQNAKAYKQSTGQKMMTDQQYKGQFDNVINKANTQQQSTTQVQNQKLVTPKNKKQNQQKPINTTPIVSEEEALKKDQELKNKYGSNYVRQQAIEAKLKQNPNTKLSLGDQAFYFSDASRSPQNVNTSKVITNSGIKIGPGIAKSNKPKKVVDNNGIDLSNLTIGG